MATMQFVVIKQKKNKKNYWFTIYPRREVFFPILVFRLETIGLPWKRISNAFLFKHLPVEVSRDNLRAPT